MTEKFEKKVVASSIGDRITIQYMWDHEGVEHWTVLGTDPLQTMIRLPDNSFVTKDEPRSASYREV